MTIELDRDTKTRAIQSIQRYFDENIEESIGNITANVLLNFFLEDIDPSKSAKRVAYSPIVLLQISQQTPVLTLVLCKKYFRKFGFSIKLILLFFDTHRPVPDFQKVE